MTQILVEENFRHIDGQDMEDLIAALAALGLVADPTQPRTPVHGHPWVMVLHWIQDELPPAVAERLTSTLPGTVREIFGRPRAADHPSGSDVPRVVPGRIEIHSPTGGVLRAIPM
ncbi:hypothetical protein [Streptacidiphilus rugosus]|uniref:hypothetical protein n=1 Tax=Streptacidiphilus rugosus TaxID=405783 RepID=UPI000568CC1A|nr:hypothetical protein [Streptacidiphilus rugosus]